MPEDIESISDYLKIVLRHTMGKNGIVVFRGEDQVFPKPCRPNIFRKESIATDVYFEKKLLDSMRQNDLSNDKCYLYNAIDAQHGTFPSRMLDVSYNCLIALYFAVTAFYKLGSDDINDDEDGMVYIMNFENAYSPSSSNIQDAYENIITRKDPLLCNNILFSKNHKLIDHCRINKRITVQQGAFVLFQGDDSEGIPAFVYTSIKIPSSRKSLLREQLNQLFGIHTGFVYPEIDNLVNELSHKCKKIEVKDVNFDTELECIEEQFGLELEYYYEQIITKESDTAGFIYTIKITEKILQSYYIGIKQLEKYLNDSHNGFDNKDRIHESFRRFKNQYNNLLEEFTSSLNTKNINHNWLNPKQFMINVGEGEK